MFSIQLFLIIVILNSFIKIKLISMYYTLFNNCMMSVVISIRLPKKLKEKMDSLRDRVNWSEEIRRFLEKKVMEYHRKKVVEEIHRVIEKFPESKVGTAASYVREDRDSN